MNITIIGGSGFVGTHLIQLLKGKDCYSLLNLDKRSSESFLRISRIANVLDTKALTTSLVDADVVVLLAAEHRDDVRPVSLYYDVNVRGMKNTLDAMQANGVKRIIFTSSVAVYGLNKANPTEDFPADPFNHYGKSKWKAEEVLLDWHRQHPDWNINIIRPTVIFGEGNRGNVFNLLQQIASGRFMMVGKGDNEKSMSYVGNVVAFIQFLIDYVKEGYNVYNYVDKPDFTTNDLVFHTGKILNRKIPTIRVPYVIGLLGGYCFDLLALLSRKKLKISSVRIKKFCAVTQFDANKALSSGFTPPFPLEEGLQRTLLSEFITTPALPKIRKKESIVNI